MRMYNQIICYSFLNSKFIINHFRYTGFVPKYEACMLYMYQYHNIIRLDECMHFFRAVWFQYLVNRAAISRYLSSKQSSTVRATILTQ